MKLSARNQFKGKIIDIQEGAVNGIVKIDIGGGCSEGAVIRDAVRIIGTGRYQIVDIDLTGNVAESDGMVCGGTMKVLVEDGSES